mgnify:CR=1 FL=1
MRDYSNLVRRWVDALVARPDLQLILVVLGCVALAITTDWLVRQLLRRSVGHWPEWSIERLGKIARQAVFLTIVLMGVMWVIDAVELADRPERIALALSKSLVILAWLILGARSVRIVLEALGRRPTPPAIAQPTTASLVRNTLVVVLGLAGLYAVLSAWGVNITGLVASAGLAGLAVSLAAQDTLGDIVSGIAILTDKPYRIGDYIVLDTGERGAVTAIGLRSTRLLTRDDVEVCIPNGVMGRAKIVNESGSPFRKYRLRVPLRIGYGSDIDQVMSLILSAAGEHSQVCESPEARMRLRSFSDYGLDFEMLCWIDEPANRGLVLHELNCTIYRLFAREGIVMPIPQQELHFTDGGARSASMRPQATSTETSTRS